MSRTVLALITVLVLASYLPSLDAAVIGPGPCSAASWGQPAGGAYHVDKNWIGGTAPCLGGEKDVSSNSTV